MDEPACNPAETETVFTPVNASRRLRQTFPLKPIGLYDPSFEKDSCGIGLVARISGFPSREIVENGMSMLNAMDHRGARGSDADTGDGAGLMAAMPHGFFKRIVRESFGQEVPELGRYGVGMIFLPKLPDLKRECKLTVERFVAAQGQKLIGWRAVPTRAKEAGIGATARLTEPDIEQIFIGAAEGCNPEEFTRQLYLIRKQAYHALQDAKGEILSSYYVASFSSSTIVYKGQLTPAQLPAYYPDLNAPDFASHLAIVHSRFSTNTFPSWDRAQPMRYVSHNGEINTLKGNINWAKAREQKMGSAVFGAQFEKLLPIIDPVTSDSGMFDNVLELLTITGRCLPEAMMMMVPEAWHSNPELPEEVRSFYEFNSCLMEPWDGPAAITFADRRYAGAALDRNGLRPCRYCITADGRLIVGSETGALRLAPETVLKKGRIAPGKMILVDFDQKRIVSNEEIKAEVARKRHYGQFLARNCSSIEQLTSNRAVCTPADGRLVSRLTAFGYTRETADFMLLPMLREGRDPVGSMGSDTPVAPLSKKPHLVFDYLKQLFAQVTNPPIDPIREDIVMSLECFVGPEGNLLAPGAQSCKRLRLPHPVLNIEEMTGLKEVKLNGWRTKVIDTTMCPDSSLEQRLLQIAFDAKSAVEEDYAFIVLSDAHAGSTRIHVPSLLACGAVHHSLLVSGLRTKVGLFVETGEAREVHHFCCLFGFGADGVHPYLAHEYLVELIAEGRLEGASRNVLNRYRKALEKGILKVLAKLGISTLQSYKGAQAFEALGLAQEVVDLCLVGAASRLGGHGFGDLQKALVAFHERAEEHPEALTSTGDYHWRAGGEKHMWNPETIASLQKAARSGDPAAYDKFAEFANQSNGECTLRTLLKFKDGADPVPLEEVESEAMIVRRFSTGAMSFGSISKEAHETVAIAMNRIGGKSNTGEGGEDSKRWTPDENGDIRRSAIKQVASGRFGVTIQYLANADEIQIKMAQGAKPGEGGELPGPKVGEEIARIRCSTPGVGLISPPPHHDIYSIEDLAQLIFDLKCANPMARVSVKLVSEAGVGVIAAGVAKAHAHHILISGCDGGTGASPLTSIKNAGLPWELGLAETHQTLVLNGLRGRVRIQADGQMKTGFDVAIAALLGADEIGFSTAPLISLGCVMMRKCHLNTCPVGVATQDPVLREKFEGKPEHLINYLFMVAADLRRIMAEHGFRTFDEMVGRADRLEVDRESPAAKRSKLDLSKVLTVLAPAAGSVPCEAIPGPSPLLANAAESLEEAIWCATSETVRSGIPGSFSFPIQNTDRTVGTTLSYEIARAHPELLPDDTIVLKLRGSAGQSLGAWLAKGVSIHLEGETNDYLGKGLSGGRIAVFPPSRSRFRPEDSVIAGNAVLYGATSGEAYISGSCCERFAVRNSGALAVVEGVGDHGCEYMTGGRIVVLGNIGRNFGAGMSGGIAYVLAQQGVNPTDRFNRNTVELEKLTDLAEIEMVRKLLHKHRHLTGSLVAKEALNLWDDSIRRFIKVMPKDYKRAIEASRAEELAPNGLVMA